MSLEKEEERCGNTFCPQLKRPGSYFRRHPAKQEKVCSVCYTYYKRNGKDREVIVTKRRREEHETNCATFSRCANTACNQTILKGNHRHPITKEKVCRSCYSYYIRKGKDREVARTLRKKEKHEKDCANAFCKRTLSVREYNDHPETNKKICNACYNYYKVNGKDREVIKTVRRREKHETNCANTFCKRTLITRKFNVHPVTKEKICHDCYLYHKKKGKDRTLIMEAKRKIRLETNCSNTFCKLLLPPGIHAIHPVTKEKICVDCYLQWTRTTEEGVIEEEDSETDWDEEEEENEESTSDIDNITTSNVYNEPNCYHPFRYINETQSEYSSNQFYKNSQEYQSSRGQKLVANTLAGRFDCYQPGSYNSGTNWNQEFVPMYEHQEAAQFTSNPSQVEVSNCNVYNQLDCHRPLGYNNVFQKSNQFYNFQEYQYSREQQPDCYQPASYNSETDWNQEFVPQFEINTSHMMHCYEPPQEDFPIVYSSESSAGTTLEPAASISFSDDPDIQVAYESHFILC
ncbi:hypothetical protein CRE_23519 [Caenorhabditis remanei]|uniref:GATA-type domain-containing protein n=1 Tax=Caenorhabditis remanei TaxID=31234 RepID=E3MH58_CAERE|nr:hypothetical protein CRE_23519 [Caenorhabditis remanei]